MSSAQVWIEQLGLTPHPEGGFFREVYRSDGVIPESALPDGFSGDRNFATSIYFLLQDDEFSAFHRIRQDELWYFHDGVPLTVHVINADGHCSELKLGRDIANGCLPQGVVRAGSWFAASVEDSVGFSLVGCTVAPGFEFADFEMPTKASLTSRFPQHAELIGKLTRS